MAYNAYNLDPSRLAKFTTRGLSRHTWIHSICVCVSSKEACGTDHAPFRSLIKHWVELSGSRNFIMAFQSNRIQDRAEVLAEPAAKLQLAAC